MNPLLFLAVGLTVLLALGVPALRIARVAAADRHHLEARLKTLRTAGEAAPELATPLGRLGLAARSPRAVQRLLARADVTLRTRSLLAAGTMVTLICVAVGLVFGPLWAAASLLGQLGAAVLILRRLAARRLAAFTDGLPVLLDATRQLLLVGNSFQQAIVKAGHYAAPPVQRYLQLLLRRMQNGASVGDALGWLADRLDVPELYMFAAAVQTNIRHGGRLTNVLASVSKTMRDRARIERELRASTAETRMSGLALVALPVGIAALITVRNPDCVAFFLGTTAGHRLGLAAVGLEVSGFFIMRRIMRLDF